jgi:hypothetical protein
MPAENAPCCALLAIPAVTVRDILRWPVLLFRVRLFIGQFQPEKEKIIVYSSEIFSQKRNDPLPN